MSRRFIRSMALALLGLTIGGASARAEFVVALGSNAASGNVFVTFDNATPGTTTTTAVSGLGANVNLLDIDFRPANGVLYGLGSNSILYTINVATGVATAGQALSVALSGTQFGIDFNPTVDRLRIVGNTGQNLRVNVDAATNNTIVDGPLGISGIVGAAYTNNFAGATSTTLFDLSYTGSSFFLNRQNPPNSGGIEPVGSTGIFSTSPLVGFDISGQTGTAFVASNFAIPGASSVATLATIDLNSGNVLSVAAIGSPGFVVRGVATNVGTAVPEPASIVMLGVGLIGVGVVARRRSTRTN